VKKAILAVAALMVALAVLLPFASKTPDGLETLTENSATQQESAWNGLMANYSAALGDPYVSTLVAGLFGVGIVLIAGFALGSAAQKKAKAPQKI
jgi:hypothetical protein